MKKVGILYICTGKYDILWEDFYKSCEKNLLPKSKKTYYVFTDAKKIYGEDKNINIKKIYQENLGWPNNTLMRFHIFKNIEKDLKKEDYLYFFNANCEFIKPITEEEFLPDPYNLVVVQHPGYYNIPNFLWPYERRKKSTAYIKRFDGKYYVMGAVNGGKTKDFLKLIDVLSKNIDKDLKNNIIAKWHDESQLNKYINNRDDYKILTPSYCYHEETLHDKFEPIIVLRDKKKYFDVDNVKNKTLLSRIKTYINLKIIRKYIFK